MPVEDQASIYSEETNRSCKLFTSGVHYAHEEAYYCLGFLRHPFHSDLHQNIQQWPTGYRHNIMPDVFYHLSKKIVGTYSTSVMKLAAEILDPTCEVLSD
uniref:Uncharacterized protein n=1 Tax=Salix viminalis TaxID=40686 RepID=A0A6N2LBT2_SALVM